MYELGLSRECQKLRPTLKSYELAEHLKMHPTRLSQICHGWVKPNKFEIEKLCDFFNKTEAELFTCQL